MESRVWTCKDALAWTTDYLTRKGDESPRRAAEWLLSAATGLTRVELYAYWDRPLSPDERAAYRELVAKRAQGMPLQYVTGEMPFRHLVLRAEPGVFIPRPETEVLVDVVLENLPAGEPLVADLCTGTGAVAVSVAYERPDATVFAGDLSEDAVGLAIRNAANAGVADRVQVAHGDLFACLPQDRRGRFDVVVSNPPYIPTADVDILPVEVLGFEPRLALDGGRDGLDVARRIWAQAPIWLRSGGALVLELDEGRVCDAASELMKDFTGVEVRKDLAGRDRIVVARTREAMDL